MERRRNSGPRTTAILLAGLVMVLSGCGSSREAPGGQGSAGDPPVGEGLGHDVRFYVNPDGNAVQAVAGLRNKGRKQEARRLQRGIASQPTATWLTDDSDAVYGEARSITEAAAAQDTLPVLVAYNLPNRDCGLYSSGGAADIDTYLDWLGSLAAGIGRKPALVVLEPDAIAQSLEGCGSDGATDERYRMLAEAVDILERQPHVRVYLDAGNASWIEDLDALAAALEASGVTKADGFALNVSNFETTERSAAYGRKLSQRLGGAHFVIDTSRNGAGPPPTAAAKPGSHPSWCNPPGRRLGTRPTTDTGIAAVDALLWVKQPGDSDGECGGAPPAGTWYPRYAAQLLSGSRPEPSH
jgi:endoglucanase